MTAWWQPVSVVMPLVIPLLAIGAAVLYTVKSAGADESIRLAGQAFLLGGVLLGVAYGGGALVDRVTRKMTFLTRHRSSKIFLGLVLAVGIMGLIFGFMESPEWYQHAWSRLWE